MMWTQVDRAVQEFVAAHRPSWAATGSEALMSLGMTRWGLTACLLAAGLIVLVLRAWRPAAAATIALVVGTLAARLGKALVQRPRPPAAWALVHPGGWSFPSTQATQTAAVAVAFLLTGPFTGRTRRLLTVAGTATVLTIGAAMVCLGAHWPTDVVAGWAVGTLTAAVARRIPAARRAERRRPDGVTSPFAGGPAA